MKNKIKRLNLLLQIIKSLSRMLEDDVCHPASLHEFIFLVKELDEVSAYFKDYKFISTMRGPHSDELRADIDILYKKGLAAVIGIECKLVPTTDGERLLLELNKGVAFRGLKRNIGYLIADFPSHHYMREGIREIEESRDAMLREIIQPSF